LFSFGSGATKEELDEIIRQSLVLQFSRITPENWLSPDRKINLHGEFFAQITAARVFIVELRPDLPLGPLTGKAKFSCNNCHTGAFPKE